MSLDTAPYFHNTSQVAYNDLVRKLVSLQITSLHAMICYDLIYLP